MNILIAPGMLAGHVIPFLATAAGLVRQGHNVLFLGETYALRLVRTSRCRRVRLSFPRATEAFLRVEQLNEQVAVARRFAEASAEDVRALLRREIIDVVLTDQMNPGAGLAVERSGVPWCSMAICPALLYPDFDDWPSRIPLGAIRRRLGLSPRADNSLIQGISPWCHLLPWIPELDSLPVPPQSRHIGVPYEDDIRATRLTRWLRASPEHPRVLVSLSTSPGRGLRDVLGRFLAELWPALEKIGARTVVTVPSEVMHPRRSAFLRFEEFVDHGVVLGDVDMVVSHGGWGTVSRVMSRGLPQLVVPFERDQFFNAQLCQSRGAGLALLAEHATTASLCAALTRLLQPSGAIRRTVDRLKRRFATAGGAEHTMTILQEVARMERVTHSGRRTRSTEGASSA